MGAKGPWKGVCGALPSSHAHAGHHSADGPACGTSIDLQPSRALSAFCLVACCHRAGRADGAGPGQLTFPQAPPSGISSGLGKPDGCMDTGTRTSQARIRAVGCLSPLAGLGSCSAFPGMASECQTLGLGFPVLSTSSKSSRGVRFLLSHELKDSAGGEGEAHPTDKEQRKEAFRTLSPRGQRWSQARTSQFLKGLDAGATPGPPFLAASSRSPITENSTVL